MDFTSLPVPCPWVILFLLWSQPSMDRVCEPKETSPPLSRGCWCRVPMSRKVIITLFSLSHFFYFSSTDTVRWGPFMKKPPAWCWPGIEKRPWGSKELRAPILDIETLPYIWLSWLVFPAPLTLIHFGGWNKCYIYRSVSLNWKPLVNITGNFEDEMPEAS